MITYIMGAMALLMLMLGLALLWLRQIGPGAVIVFIAFVLAVIVVTS